MSRRLFSLLLASLLVALLGSCGAIRFQHAWSSARAEPGSEPSGLSGRWKGSWRSEWNGHSGGLRCLLEPRGDGQARAWFYSTYGWLLFFQHEVLLSVAPEEAGRLRFEGEEDLGPALGGVYHYRGQVVGNSFHAHYDAESGDHGVFEMERVPDGSGR